VSEIDALQTTLAAEHAAVFVYGALGGRTSLSATPVLHDAIAAAQGGKQPLEIQARSDGAVKTYTVDYDGGLKYPHLVREQGKPDYLKSLLAPKPVGSGS
jgi:hypothetical protein